MISVVVPTRNRPALLDAALRSVAEQTHTDLEVVVVNDGGTPVSPVVDRWASDLRITSVDLGAHRGASATRNVGLRYTSGTHIAFLDDDDVFLPDHLGTAAETFASVDTDLVYLGALVSDRRLDRLPPDRSGHRRKAYPFSDEFLLVANYIHTGSVVVRDFRDTPVRFDESLTHGEDWDLWLALRFRLGYRMTFVDALTSIYHQVPDTAGLVSQGQATVPSPFSLTRRRLYRRWPTASTRVRVGRAWLSAVDDACDDRVLTGGSVPTHLFDRALGVLHQSLRTRRAPDHSAIPALFDEPATAGVRSGCGR